MKAAIREFRFHIYSAMGKEKKVIIMVVEGESELEYLSQLNRYLREEEIGYVFYPVKAVNGQYREVRKCYREVKKSHRKERIEILVDRDIYIRDEKERVDYTLRTRDGLPPFTFSYMNWEDYLILHLSKEKALKWCEICRETGHFEIPLTAKEYLRAQEESGIWGRVHYKKGRVPFEITKKRLERAVENDRDKDIEIHSDFVNILLEILPR